MGRRGARMRDRGESSMGSQMVVGRTEEAAGKAGRKGGGRGGQKEFETAREPLYYKYHL